ncbi:hypothetical protein GCM10010390_17990 [Streptomyces mordarskii]|uniref:Uncharacterized protein n=1 Tax=Streptomyces mordarskii TaxID=1226758 RepID=A0ABN1CC33_9ACTN
MSLTFSRETTQVTPTATQQKTPAFVESSKEALRGLLRCRQATCLTSKRYPSTRPRASDPMRRSTAGRVRERSGPGQEPQEGAMTPFVPPPATF